MTNLKEIILLNDESILFQLEGNAYTESANPLVKAIYRIFRSIGKIFGWSLRTYIVITNKRILRVDKEKIFWSIPRNTIVLTLPKSAIREVGYEQAVRLLFFKTLYFRFETFTEKTRIAYSGSLEEINDLVSKVTEMIAN